MSKIPVTIQGCLRLSSLVFLVLLCTTAGMIAVSYAPIGQDWTMKVVLILAIATINAVLVASHLMHLLTEKKLVYTVLGFTVFFVIGLFALTIWASADFPPGTATR